MFNVLMFFVAPFHGNVHLGNGEWDFSVCMHERQFYFPEVKLLFQISQSKSLAYCMRIEYQPREKLKHAMQFTNDNEYKNEYI